MANYNQLRNAIVAVIRQNGNNEITGDLLQGSLLSMITALGTGFNYVGLANPGTNPGTPDPNVCYLADGNGIYANFGGLSVANDEAAILKWNGDWMKETTNLATQAWVNNRGYVANSYLFENGLIKASLLPSFVDDVKEYPNFAQFPRPGESDKIYIAINTNKQYRWSGTQYVEISKSLALGYTASTAYPGDEGLANANAIATINGYFTNGVANSALQLANPRTLWGQSFDGTANVSGSMSNVGQMAFLTQVDKHDVDLEVVEINGQRYLHTHLPFFSDSQIAAGGLGTGGGGGTGTVTAIQIGAGGTIYEPVAGSTTVVIPAYPTRASLNIKALADYDTVPAALGYTPYNASNPSGYISGIDYAMVINALGYTPYNASNPDGYITGITSLMIRNALGYNPVSEDRLSNYLSIYGGTLDGDLTIAGFLDVDSDLGVSGDFSVSGQAYFYGETEIYGLVTLFNDLNANGNIIATGQITAGQASDARLKDNIKRLDDVTILRFLRPVEFDWNDTATAKCSELSGHDVGLIAQEVKPFIPSAVGNIFGEYYKVDYAKVIPYLIAGWQHLERRIADLEKQLKQR